MTLNESATTFALWCPACGNTAEVTMSCSQHVDFIPFCLCTGPTTGYSLVPYLGEPRATMMQGLVLEGPGIVREPGDDV